jgi:hypothetical protein
MKRVLLICGALMALSATAALAQATQPGLYLNWGACAGDAPVRNRNIACTVTTGSSLMVLSWVPGAEVPLLNSVEGVVKFTFLGGTTPAWWGNTCAGRTTFSGITADLVIPGTAVNCVDAWGGVAGGGIAAYNYDATAPYGYWNGPGTTTLDLLGYLAAGTELDATVGQEVFLFNVKIGNARARVADNCPGCLVPTCINFERIQITQPTGMPIDITYNSYLPGYEGAGMTPHTISWQPNAGWPGGCWPTPTLKSSWGSIKALYR